MLLPKKWKFLLIPIILFTLFSCQKDTDFIINDESGSHFDQNIGIRSVDDFPDSLWQSPTVDQLNGVWTDMMSKANADQIVKFLYFSGLFDWSLAQVWNEYSDNEYIITIPTIESGNINSVMYVAYNNGEYTYLHSRYEDLKITTQQLVDQYGAKTATILLFIFIQYEQLLDNYNTAFLLDHANDPIIQNEIIELESRGWCLIEVILYHETQVSEDVIFYHNYAYNETTQEIIRNIGPNFNRDEHFDPDDTVILYGDREPSIIHGQVTGEYTIYRFWAWCPDDIDQEPWKNNWTTNIDNTNNTGGDGNGTYTNNWDYNNERWHEDSKQCPFIFNAPRATKTFNNLEASLIASSCGAASEYIIKSTIDDILLSLCEDFYNNSESGQFGDGYNVDPYLQQIEESIKSNTIYQLGVEVCEVCANASNPLACTNAVNDCDAGNYIPCVEDILCDYAIAGFESDFGLSLSQSEKDEIRSTLSCGSINFEEDVLGVLANQKHIYLSQYPEYLAAVPDLQAFIDQYGYEKYFATSVLFEASKLHGNWEIPDAETLLFYWEMFETQLVPIGATFIPYGIGDAADIFQSCGENIANWSCALAIAGVAVPFDELYDVWKNSDKIKAAWKTVKNYSALKNAWKFIENCPKSVRTNPEYLDGVRLALQRGLKSMSELSTYANDIGATYITNNTLSHIFRGSNNGGVHHISALLADPSTYKFQNRVEIPNSNGCYRAKVHKNGTEMYSLHPDGKSFFPDSWNEEQVIDAINEAYGNATQVPNTNNWIGTGSGVNIRFYKKSNGEIISAHPN